MGVGPELRVILSENEETGQRCAPSLCRSSERKTRGVKTHADAARIRMPNCLGKWASSLVPAPLRGVLRVPQTLRVFSPPPTLSRTL